MQDTFPNDLIDKMLGKFEHLEKERQCQPKDANPKMIWMLKFSDNSYIAAIITMLQK